MSTAVTENSHDTKHNTLVRRLTEDQHSLPLSIALHLIPSVLILAAYLVIAAPLVEAIGYPPYLGWVVAMCIALAPVELGLLVYLGWRRNGRFSLRGVVDYMEKPVKKPALSGIV